MDHRRPFVATILLTTLGALAGCGAPARSEKPETQKPTIEKPRDDPVPESPRLAALARSIASGEKSELERFWKNLKDKAPLVEPIAGDDRHALVSFVWRGDDRARRVSLSGGLPAAGREFKPLQRLANTDLWYRTERLPTDARFGYNFLVNGPTEWPADVKEFRAFWDRGALKADPNNPRLFSEIVSVAELREAPPQRWQTRPKGKIRERGLDSKILGEYRTIGIYVPPDADLKSGSRRLLVMLDGEAYGDDEPATIPMPAILDGLIGNREIPPTVAVLVDNMGRRDRDLFGSEPFADFLATELVPWVHTQCEVSDDPARVVLGGFSAGGLCAAFTAMRHPEVFGNVLAQSGAFLWYPGYYTKEFPDYATETGWLTRQFVAKPRLPLRFYLEVGRFERGNYLGDNLAENRRFRDVLEAKGYPLTYREYNGDHSALCWRGSLADGLIALLGQPGRSEGRPD